MSNAKILHPEGGGVHAQAGSTGGVHLPSAPCGFRNFCRKLLFDSGRLVSHTLAVARSCEVALGRHLPVMVVGIGGSWVCL